MSGGYCITKGTEVCCTPGCQTDVRLKGIRCDVCQRLYREAFEKGYLEALRDCVALTTSFSMDRLRSFLQEYIRRADIKINRR